MALDPVSERHKGTEGFGDSVFSKMIKAGHRTYFLDVKTTRADDYFLTITELRKKITPAGTECERNKVFLYEEDFDKFESCLSEVMAFVRSRGKSPDCTPEE